LANSLKISQTPCPGDVQKRPPVRPEVADRYSTWSCAKLGGDETAICRRAHPQSPRLPSMPAKLLKGRGFLSVATAAGAASDPGAGRSGTPRPG
jgi:hypothetical protein